MGSYGSVQLGTSEEPYRMEKNPIDYEKATASLRLPKGPGGGQIGSLEAAYIPQSTDPQPYLVARGVHSILGSGHHSYRIAWANRIQRDHSPQGFAYSETAADLGSCGPGVRRVQGSPVLSAECPAATEPSGSSRRALLTGAPSKSAKAWRPFLLSQLAPSREPGLQGSDQGGRRRREQHSGISAKSRKKEKKESSELQFAAHPPPETFQTELSLLKSTTYCGLIDTVQLSDNCSVGWGRYTPRLFFNSQNKI
ncbi:uncharacterized protein LOC124089214 [Marmota monax]|uniref:uncharacterized protein LOC124089214 n=1 Tax=Marmota monax TaxID=9995 RepID=UPI001EB0006A|nr:uncharacterized protein LOC124089214 [Marmota monax]